MTIVYSHDKLLSCQQFIALLRASGLAERRPVDDPDCIAAMLAHTNLLISAWDEGRLIAVARSLTDFNYACYLSDLAVDKAYQRRGIGKRLLQLTEQQLGPRCKLILIAAPAANDYYPALGFTANRRCWVRHPAYVDEV